jgi:hypothetical protein
MHLTVIRCSRGIPLIIMTYVYDKKGFCKDFLSQGFLTREPAVHSVFQPLNKGGYSFSEHNSFKLFTSWRALFGTVLFFGVSPFSFPLPFPRLHLAFLRLRLQPFHHHYFLSKYAASLYYPACRTRLPISFLSSRNFSYSLKFLNTRRKIIRMLLSTQ